MNAALSPPGDEGHPRSSLLDPARRGYWSWVDACVPPALRAHADELRRAQLLVGFSFVCVGMGAVFSVLAAVNYRSWLTFAAALAATLAAALAPLVLRWTASLAWATGGLLSVFVSAMVLVSVASGEEQALMTLPWLAAVPLLATTLGGRAAGLVWTPACVVLAECAIRLGRVGLVPDQVPSPEDFRVASAWNLGMFIVFVSAFAILFESSRARMMSALSSAQSELHAARERSRHAERLSALGQMAAGVAHEINNPMTFVSVNLGLLREDLERGPLTEAMRREYVDDVLPATAEGLRRVIDVVADLRSFARADSDRGLAFDLDDEVRAALRLCARELADREVRVELRELPQVVGRPREIVRVVRNLLVNAAQATGPGGCVRVETERRGRDEVSLRVSDDGVGMTEDVKARIFEPFYTTRPVGNGTGLGLAVVHGIVRGHGGSVEVESRPGRGTTFDVRLPLGRGEAV